MPDSTCFPAKNRIVSIDALRGLTILVMIFVNDLAGVQNTPAWMKHIKPGSDGMTFVDWVFPAFLFIVGMSIPFAIGRRLERGINPWIVWRHIITRTLGLLVIGVFMVNTEAIANPGSLSSTLWIFFMYMAVLMIWRERIQEPGSKRQFDIGLRMIGILILILLAFLYHGSDRSGWIEMRTSWWGIMGLIGWAYLVASTIYTLLRKDLAAMMGWIAILYCVYMAGQTDFFAWIPVIPDFVDIGGMWGSLAAITLSGVILGVILAPGSPMQTHGRKMWWGFLYGLGLLIAGLMLHSLRSIDSMFIIDKNMATPPWCLISSAFTAWIWVVIYWLMDVRGWTRWAVLVEPAGQNPLFAYILAPILYAVFTLVSLESIYYGLLGNSFPIGFFRSLFFTIALTWLTGFLYKKGLRMRL